MRKKYFLFKVATSDNRLWNLMKTYFQTACFWSIFLLLIPQALVQLESYYLLGGFPPKPLIGWVVFVLFGLLGLYSGYTMSWSGRGTPLPLDCPRKLVIKGPYKTVRNPMAVAGISQAIGVGLILGSWVVVFYAVSGALLWHFIVRPIEESDLEERFGEMYLAYKKRVQCWIPKL